MQSSPSDHDHDLQLVLRFNRTGELRVLEELLVRHMSRLRQIIYPIVLNHSDADDLTQEACLRAARALPDFRGESGFSTWITRIGINTALAFLRSRKRLPPVDGGESLADLCSPLDNPRDAAATAENDARVEAALAELPPELRAAITLTVLQGLTPAQAAEACGCLTATLYWRVHQARKLLKRSLHGVLP